MLIIATQTGAQLHVEDIGSGIPVVAVHGMLGTARSNMGRVMGWLSDDYRVIGPTLRGYGESLPKPRDFPPDFYRRDAEDLLALLDAMNIAQAHLLGYSDGGETVLIAAGLQPERFLSVGTIGAVGYFGPEMRPAIQRMYPVDWVKPEEAALHNIDNPVPMVMQWIRSTKMMIDAGGGTGMAVAGAIQCPVLVMLGDEDWLNPAACAQVFLNKVSNGRLHTFPCGHAIHDQQWDAFRQVYGAFLRDCNPV
ncbi:MAG: hypothetical protein CL610_12780 [Anaerolineaceae bacterium]|nr:hypothetical protein [Anaerolineaceae bacterium]